MKKSKVTYFLDADISATSFRESCMPIAWFTNPLTEHNQYSWELSIQKLTSAMAKTTPTRIAGTVV